VTGSKALDFYEATEVSCNIWYALTGLKTGGDALAATAKQLGFGDNVPFDLPIGRSQLTNGGGNFGGGFKDAVELANASYGQAETVTTPIQMALVAATVANDGLLMQPHLVTSLTGQRSGTRTIEPAAWRRIVPPNVAAEIQQAMQRAVEGPLGKQFTSGAKVPGVPTAGKSGTAELGGQGEPNSWFIGFAPVDNPQVAIAVVVEQGGRGGARAAPLAGNLMTLALKTLGGG
jgi:peptidoglycan glycosyltransferase